MRFPTQEYWSGLTFSSPGDLPNPGIEPLSLALQADSYIYCFNFRKIQGGTTICLLGWKGSNGQTSCSQSGRWWAAGGGWVGRPRGPHPPLLVTASLHLHHVPGCRTDHHPVFTHNCIHLARLVRSRFTEAWRSLCEFSEVRQQSGSEAENRLGEADLKTRDFHPHTIFDGIEAAEEDGQGRRPLVDTEQPGTKAGMRGSRALTHTSTHSWPMTRTAPRAAQSSATPFGRQGNQTRTQTWPPAAYRWMLLGSQLWREHSSEPILKHPSSLQASWQLHCNTSKLPFMHS